MAAVNDVANFFIDWAIKSEEEHMTNLWLNKLMFFAQGHHLAKYGKPLFDETIEAWDYGPVISSVYQKYKVCGRNPIPTVDDDYRLENFTRDEQLFLAAILREYGAYTASALVSMTHRTNTPWRNAYVAGCNVEITQPAMTEYFLQPANKLRSFTNLFSTMDFSVINNRDEDGYLLLPNDGYEDEDWDEL